MNKRSWEKVIRQLSKIGWALFMLSSATHLYLYTKCNGVLINILANFCFQSEEWQKGNSSVNKWILPLEIIHETVWDERRFSSDTKIYHFQLDITIKLLHNYGGIRDNIEERGAPYNATKINRINEMLRKYFRIRSNWPMFSGYIFCNGWRSFFFFWFNRKSFPTSNKTTWC